MFIVYFSKPSSRLGFFVSFFGQPFSAIVNKYFFALLQVLLPMAKVLAKQLLAKFISDCPAFSIRRSLPPYTFLVSTYSFGDGMVDRP